MQEVAASSEEQSASTQEIAAAAATLAEAADRLGRIVAHLRLDETSAPLPFQTGERPKPVRPSQEILIGRASVPQLRTAAKT
jgi:hypothetical protein